MHVPDRVAVFKNASLLHCAGWQEMADASHSPDFMTIRRFCRKCGPTGNERSARARAPYSHKRAQLAGPCGSALKATVSASCVEARPRNASLPDGELLQLQAAGSVSVCVCVHSFRPVAE